MLGTDLQLRWNPRNVCMAAIKNGNFNTLITAWKLQPPVYRSALLPEHIGEDGEIIEEVLPSFRVQPMEAAASLGRHDMMNWLRSNGCPWGSNTCRCVQDAGYSRISQWAAMSPGGCPCNTDGHTMSSLCTVHSGTLGQDDGRARHCEGKYRDSSSL